MHTVSRRRGDALVGAIHDAVVAELAAVGYDALSIERVAERSHTGKASIYRRWPSKLELVLDAVDSRMPGLGVPPDTGSVREDLLTILRRVAKHMNSRAGDAFQACIGDAKHHRALAAPIRERLIAPRQRVILEVLQRGVDRGEVRPDALTERIISLGPMLLLAERQARGGPLRDAEVVAVVDEILIPLLRTEQLSGSRPRERAVRA